jgi:hypothetical protein
MGPLPNRDIDVIFVYLWEHGCLMTHCRLSALSEAISTRHTAIGERLNDCIHNASLHRGKRSVSACQQCRPPKSASSLNKQTSNVRLIPRTLTPIIISTRFWPTIFCYDTAALFIATLTISIQ